MPKFNRKNYAKFWGGNPDKKFFNGKSLEVFWNNGVLGQNILYPLIA